MLTPECRSTAYTSGQLQAESHAAQEEAPRIRDDVDLFHAARGVWAKLRAEREIDAESEQDLGASSNDAAPAPA